MAEVVSRRQTAAVSIRTVGFEELLRDLGLAAGQLKQLEGQVSDKAAREIAKDASKEGRSQGSVAAKAAPSVRYSGGGTVVYGGEAYSMGAEFGSISHSQFKPWRGNGEEAGYFLFPTVREWQSKNLVDLWMDMLEGRVIKPITND